MNTLGRVSRQEAQNGHFLSALLTRKMGLDPGEKSPGSEPLERTISLATDADIVAGKGPAEGLSSARLKILPTYMCNV